MESIRERVPSQNQDDGDEHLIYVEVSKIQPNRNQPRSVFDNTAMEELADSIDRDGLLQPISIRPIDDGPEGIEYEIIAGERRWRAHRMLDKKRIRAIVKETYDEKQSIIGALIENLQRENLTALEEAVALKRAMEELGMRQDDLAKMLGKSRAYISNTVRLLHLQPEVKQMLENGQLSAAHGVALITLPKEKQLARAEEAFKKGWTVEKMKAVLTREAKRQKEAEKEPGMLPEKSVQKEKKYLLLIALDDKVQLLELKEELVKNGFACYTGKAIKNFLEDTRDQQDEQEQQIEEAGAEEIISELEEDTTEY